ncbi:MAG TPA: ribonuclease E/G, partial [Candidatus Sumerlaeota bacterium]|nr:ribonuclease E/G [Candidatus Sumerlaeota bacterium]
GEDDVQRAIEASKAIPNQLRLRDIGGIVVVDFIDMRSRDNQLAVEHEFRKQMKEDRAKYSILPISEFGLLEITRKRVRQSLGHQIFSSCPYCEGSGRVMAPNQIWREIKYSILNLMQKKPTPTEVTVVMHPRTKNFIQEKMMDSLKEMEKQYKVPVSLLSSEDLHIEDFKVKYSLPERTQAGGRGQRQITLSSGE